MIKRIKHKGRRIAAVLACCMMLSVTSCGSGIEYIDETTGTSSESADSSKDWDIWGNSGHSDTNAGSGNGSGSGSNDEYTYNPDAVYADIDNPEFQQFMKDYFVDAVTEDSLSYNYTIMDGSVYGVEPPVATLGDLWSYCL